MSSSALNLLASTRRSITKNTANPAATERMAGPITECGTTGRNLRANPNLPVATVKPYTTIITINSLKITDIMKKALFTLTILAAIAMAGQSPAQEKGKFWIGGSLGFGSANMSETANSSKSFSIMPEFGYTISDRWAVGIQGGFEQTKLKGVSSPDNTRTYSISPFARYTFLKWRAFSVFADGGLTWSDTDRETGSSGDYFNVKTRYGGIFVSPGFSVRLSRRLSLTGSTNIFNAGYGKTSASSDNVTEKYSVELNSPFNLGNFSVGFNICF